MTQAEARAAERAYYETGAGGWADGRFGQCYDLLDAILREHHPESEIHELAKLARDKCEDADVALGKLK